MPATHLISGDVPAPLSPTSAITSPLRTSKSTSESAWTDPNDFDRPRISRRGSSLMVAGFLPHWKEEAPGGRLLFPSLLDDYLQYFLYLPMQTSPLLRNFALKRRVEFA